MAPHTGPRSVEVFWQAAHLGAMSTHQEHGGTGMSGNHGGVETKKKEGVLGSLMVGIIIMAFGFAVGLPWLSSVHDERRLISEGVHAVGTATDVSFTQGARRKSSNKIVTYSFTSDSGAGSTVEDRGPYWKLADGSHEEVTEKLLGTEKTVFYDPDDLGDAIVEGDARSYTGPVVFLTIFTVVGGFLTYAVADQAIKDRRKETLPA